MTTKPIAPLIFKALPENARPTSEAWVECFNTGLDESALTPLTEEFDHPRNMAADVVIVAGLFPLCVGMMLYCLSSLTGISFNSGPNTDFRIPDVVLLSILPGVGVAALGSAWAVFLKSTKNRRAKAWKQALSDAWLAHGGQIIALKDVPKSVREEVTDDLCKLDEIRRGLNRLDPDGDELDDARDAIVRYIEASDIPLLGKRAAAATHIKDPAVRQAAKEYEQAVQAQGFTRKRVDLALGAAWDLLDSRRQERTDADIIKLVHER
ncbi:hypothetical protein [Arthrobacter sp. UYCo732]|uniref:hypothetical protein n=1 Tax=Arthrobacter sp. UYCo732 TaxID=3156336 RepID=UPI00339A2F0D